MYKDKTKLMTLLMTPYLPIFPWNFYGLDENHPIFSQKLLKSNFVTFLVLVGFDFS